MVDHPCPQFIKDLHATKPGKARKLAIDHIASIMWKMRVGDRVEGPDGEWFTKGDTPQ